MSSWISILVLCC